MSELIETLNNLTSPKYIEKMYIGADKAINEIALDGLVSSFREFENIIVEFMKLLHKYVLKANRTINGAEEYYLDAGFKVLQEKYGPNGEKAAFEMARTGKQGGIYAVIKVLAYGPIDIGIENEAKAKVGVLWEKLGNDQKFAVMDEYVKTHGHLWPDELIENGAVRLKMNFPKTLQLHIENVRKLSKSLDI